LVGFKPSGFSSCDLRRFGFQRLDLVSCDTGSASSLATFVTRGLATPCVCHPFVVQFLLTQYPHHLASARKEVIQPHLPVRLPCYDFVPVISPTLGSSSLAVRSPTSGVTNSHDVTGGVYKARERIHRSMADLRLLATPASCRRVAAYNPNYEQL
jgi:hypothetical protein